jgi:hypothetical protein
VREKLDFSRRKQELGSVTPAQARSLSSFAYSGVQQALDSSAFPCRVASVAACRSP